jgi:nucleotide-binding universal stress UspA family protein
LRKAHSGERPTVVVGFEDNDRGRDALMFGAGLARRLDLSVLVVTVVPYPRHLLGPADLELALGKATAEPFRYVEDELADLEPVTIAVPDHSPSRALTRVAEEERAELIVVGSASHTGPMLVIAGTAGKALLHGAPCAVAVAPTGYAERATGAIHRIGVAFDGSPESWSALETGIALSRAFGSTLAVIAVTEPPVSGFSETMDAIAAEELLAAVTDETQQVLDLALERVPAEIETESRLVDGLAADRIVESSADLDLLMLGSRGYGPLRRTLLGSVARAVVSRAPCPVLVLPRAGGADPLRIRGDIPAAATG